MEYIIDGINFSDLEAEKYWVHPKSQQNKASDEAKQMIFSGNYIGARKMDGAYFRFIKDMDGNMCLQSRSESVNGGYLDKIEWVPQLHDFFNALPNGTCLLGEIYFPNNEGSRHVTTIMGCLKNKAIERQNKGDKLNYYIFDIWAWNGHSYMKTDALTRFAMIGHLNNDKRYNQYNYVQFAKYYIGQDLWDELIRVRAANGEGIVITKSNSYPEPGKRTARKTLKIKKELDNPIDCFITGKYKPSTREYNGDYIETWQYWYDLHEGVKKFGNYYGDYSRGATIIPVTKGWYNGWASAIEIGILDGNNIVSLGWISGIDEEVKNGIVNTPEKYIHRVVKINAMEMDKENMTLRHGKIMEWRLPGDKDWRECTIDQI